MADCRMPEEFMEIVGHHPPPEEPIGHHLPPEEPIGRQGGRPPIAHLVVLKVLWYVLSTGWVRALDRMPLAGRAARDGVLGRDRSHPARQVGAGRDLGPHPPRHAAPLATRRRAGARDGGGGFGDRPGSRRRRGDRTRHRPQPRGPWKTRDEIHAGRRRGRGRSGRPRHRGQRQRPKADPALGPRGVPGGRRQTGPPASETRAGSGRRRLRQRVDAGYDSESTPVTTASRRRLRQRVDAKCAALPGHRAVDPQDARRGSRTAAAWARSAGSSSGRSVGSRASDDCGYGTIAARPSWTPGRRWP